MEESSVVEVKTGEREFNPPTVETLIERLSKYARVYCPVERILNIYLWGSRVYGTDSPSSDWDFLILLSDPPPPGITAEQQHSKQLQPTSNNVGDIDSSKYIVYQDEVINATFIPETDFKLLLYAHHHIPLQVISLDDYNLETGPKNGKGKLLERLKITHEVDPDIIRRTVLVESRQRWRSGVSRFREKGNEGKDQTEPDWRRTALQLAKKDMVHSFRYLIFATQIVKYGKIVDYGGANEYFYKIVKDQERIEQDEESEWKRIQKKWQPEWDKVRDELKNTAKFIRMYSTREMNRIQTSALKIRFHNDKIMNHIQTGDKKQNNNNNNNSNNHTNSPSTQHPSNVKDPHLAIKLRNNEITLEDLNGVKYNINYCRHSVHRNLILFHYNLYECSIYAASLNLPQAKEWMYECKGLILDESDDWKVIVYPFPRIPDYHEVDLSQYKLDQKWTVDEYIDGIGVTLYNYKNNWYISSFFEPDNPQAHLGWKDNSSMDEETGELNYTVSNQSPSFEKSSVRRVSTKSNELDDGTTISNIFWRIWKENNYQLPNYDKTPGVHYTFVMVTPSTHRFIIRYPQDDLVLVSCKNIEKNKEYDPVHIAKEHNWTRVQRSELAPPPAEQDKPMTQFISELTIQSNQQNPFKHKGYVVRDSNFNRFKVYNKESLGIEMTTDFSTYGLLNISASLDENRVIDLIRFNKLDKFLNYYPEWSEFAKSVEDRFKKEMCVPVEGLWSEIFTKYLSQQDTTKAKSEFSRAAKTRGPKFDYLLFRMLKEHEQYHYEWMSVREFYAIAIEESWWSRMWNALCDKQKTFHRQKQGKQEKKTYREKEKKQKTGKKTEF